MGEANIRGQQAMIDLAEIQLDLEKLKELYGHAELPFPLRDHLDSIAEFNADAPLADLLEIEREHPEAYFLEPIRGVFARVADNLTNRRISGAIRKP